MVKGRRGPRGCVVARRACDWKTSSGVRRARGPVVICLVARVAIGGQRCVIVIGVALRTGNCYVRAGQWEAGRRMIERRGTPSTGGVAYAAIGGEAGSDVTGIGGSSEIGLMAGVARGRR